MGGEKASHADPLDLLYNFVQEESERAQKWRDLAETSNTKCLFEGVRIGCWNLLKYIEYLKREAST